MSDGIDPGGQPGEPEEPPHREEPAPGGRERYGWWFVRCLVVVFAMAATLNGTRPMASYRAVAMGASPAELGIVAASFAALSLMIAIPAGRWVDRWGEVRFLVVGPAVMAGGCVWAGFAGGIPTLAMSQALLGVGQILLAVGAQTLVAGGASRLSRDSRFGMMAVAISLGQVTGPAVSGTLAGASSAGPQVVFLGAAGAMVAATAVAASYFRWPPQATGGGTRRRPAPSESLLRASRSLLRLPNMKQAMYASFAALGSIDILIAYLPAYGDARGLPVRTVGFLLAAHAAAALLSRILMGFLINMFGRRQFLAFCLALPGLAVAAIPLTGNPGVLLPLMCCMGFGLGVSQPMTIAWVAARAPVDQRGTALGIRHTGNRLAQLTVPATAGLLAGATGLATIFWSVGLLLSSSSLVVFRADFEDP